MREPTPEGWGSTSRFAATNSTCASPPCAVDSMRADGDTGFGMDTPADQPHSSHALYWLLGVMCRCAACTCCGLIRRPIRPPLSPAAPPSPLTDPTAAGCAVGVLASLGIVGDE